MSNFELNKVKEGKKQHNTYEQIKQRTGLFIRFKKYYFQNGSGAHPTLLKAAGE
jgi:hypothetical protein